MANFRLTESRGDVAIADRVLLESEPEPVSHYCHVVRAGDMVWVSGTTARGDDGEPQAEGPTEQARVAVQALGTALAAVGSGPADVVRVSNWLTRIDDRAAVNVARREFFGETLPASILCEVPRLVDPGLVYEIDAVAMVGGEKQRVTLPGSEPFSHYCDVVRCGDLVWVSGCGALGPGHQLLAPGDATEQARIALENLRLALAAVGARVEDVVKVTNLLTNMDDRAHVNIARREFFGDTLPASIIAEVPRLVVPGMLYEVDAIAVIGGTKQRVTLPGSKPISHYCDVVRAGDLVWVTGQAAAESTPDGSGYTILADGDAEAQARIAHEHLGEALAAVGATPADVVKVTNYLTDIDDRTRVNTARKAFFGDTRPASVLVEVPKLVLPGLIYEVEAVAVIGAGRQS
jgi:2-iminobutanoate/2-iminopropanoate deaminase